MLSPLLLGCKTCSRTLCVLRRAYRRCGACAGSAPFDQHARALHARGGLLLPPPRGRRADRPRDWTRDKHAGWRGGRSVLLLAARRCAPLLANVAFAGVDAAFQTAAHCHVFLHATSVLAPPATRDAAVAFVLSATALLVTELRRGRTPDRVTCPSEDLTVRIGEVIDKGNLPVSLKSGLKRVWNQTSGGQFYTDFTSASGAGVRAKHEEEFEAATGDLLAAAVRKDIAIHGLRACGLASCDKREARGSQQFLFVLD